MHAVLVCPAWMKLQMAAAAAPRTCGGEQWWRWQPVHEQEAWIANSDVRFELTNARMRFQKFDG